MPYRVVSPDRKLYLVDSEDDLKAVGERYKLTSKQIGNIRQLLGWAGVGNHNGDRNDRSMRAEAENFMLLHNIHWLRHDDGTEYVPLVGKPQHMFDNVVKPRLDIKIGSRASLNNLLNGAKGGDAGGRKKHLPGLLREPEGGWVALVGCGASRRSGPRFVGPWPAESSVVHSPLERPPSFAKGVSSAGVPSN